MRKEEVISDRVQSTLVRLRAGRIRWTLVSAGLSSGFFFLGCATYSPPPKTIRSALDRLYLEPPGSKFKEKAVAVEAYRSVVAQTLSSQCTYEPSDSHYAERAIARCGPLPGLIKSVGRFMVESDAADWVQTVSVDGKHVKFVDPLDDCALF